MHTYIYSGIHNLEAITDELFPHINKPHWPSVVEVLELSANSCLSLSASGIGKIAFTYIHARNMACSES